jgi:3-oxoacyl-[acyl-carrier protein] reductase
MTDLLDRKTALVTGASRGIGAGIAKGLATARATVVVNYATNRADADAVVDEIKACGGTAWAVQADVSKHDDVARMFAEVAERVERLDILVNNAGIHAAEPIEAVTAEHFHKLFDINVLGLLLTTQAAIPLFGASGGSIINISALASRMSSPDMSVYAGTKGAVDAITLSLSKELGPKKIRVNSINPGSIETEGLAKSGFAAGDMRDLILSGTPLGRLGRPEDIANIAILLASDEAYWINGQIIFAAGGLTY